jgi:hypothetical protein
MKFDERLEIAILPSDVSRTDDKGPAASRREATERGADDEGDPAPEFDAERVSSVQPISGGDGVADEANRTRLICDIMRLIREAAMPESTRNAGMTLVGWLARRRPDEAPHAIGIEEARESERRIRAARKRG